MPWKPDYIDTEDLKAYLNVSDSVDDVQLAIWCTAASRAVDKRCNRQFGNVSAAVTRTYRGPAFYDHRSGLWLVEIDDVHDATDLTIGGVAYADSGAVLLPDNAPADGEPWQRLGFTSCPDLPMDVETSGWGWAAVPAQVVGASKLQANRWNKRRNAPFGIAGSPDQGSELRLLARLDPDVATTLSGLSRRRRVG